jgi:DNA topoisomerase-1
MKEYGEIRLLNGRYGPYLTKDKKNYRLPKGTQVDKLTEEDCIRIIEESEKPKKSTD